MKYFAYGSNMLPARLNKRVSCAAIIRSPCVLGQHRLVFHKIGKDGSAKCDALFTNKETDHVEGVLYDISEADISPLDEIEKPGYEKKAVTVIDKQGHSFHAFMYYATIIDDSLQPFTWYKRHVVEGAIQAGLSQEYISRIESMLSKKDLDTEREKMELTIYEQ